MNPTAGVPLHFDGTFKKFLGVVLGKGWGLAFAPSYLYNLSDRCYTGFTLGIRLEHEEMTTWTGRDD